MLTVDFDRLDIGPGSLVLDMGAGAGRHAFEVFKRGADIVALSKKHTISEWAVQGAVDPIPVERAEGIYFYTPEGKRYIDFNSQLMSVNIGHSDPRVVKAIQEQAATSPRQTAPLRREASSRQTGRCVEWLETRRWSLSPSPPA